MHPRSIEFVRILLSFALLLATVPAAVRAEEWGGECNACPPGARWRPGSEVRIDAPGELLSGALVYGARDAARVLGDGPCATPALFVEPVDETSFERDGRSSIVWMEEPPETGAEEQVLAATCNLCDADGFIIESDIEVFGPAERWNDNCLGPEFSERGVLLHELGHLLGLSHEPVDGGSVMFGMVTAARSHRFGSPGVQDFEALCDRYGTRAAALVVRAEAGCPAAFGIPGERCGTEDPVPAGMVCGATDEGRAWAWQCSALEPCEEGATCSGAEETATCVPDLPRHASGIGAECTSDADCGDGLCGQDAAGISRCLERCSPSLACDGYCGDVVAASAYRGRWCIPDARRLEPRAERMFTGCGAGGTTSSPMLLFGLLLLMARRRRAFRLATDRPAP